MPTKAQMQHAQSLRPAIIQAFLDIGTVKPVAIKLGVSQELVRKALDEAGIDRPRKGQVSFGWKGVEAGVDAGRARARNKYALGPCERCGKTATDRHHVDANTLNNATENIQILCRRCHMIVDGRFEEFRTAPRKGKKSQGTTCATCGCEFWPLRKGRCSRCAQHFYKYGKERPLVTPPITHCPRGHEYTPSNTRIDKKGCKCCRACRAEDGRRTRRLAKAIIAGTTEDPRGNL